MMMTKYGEIYGIKQHEFYSNGNLKECTVEEEFELETSYGKFIPKYDDSINRRKNKSSLEFFETGILKKLYMQEQSIVETDYGKFPVEMIIFYDNGNIKKIFPLNGKITGFWTEEHEYELSEEIKIETKAISFSKKLMSIVFYKSGSIKNITMWARERVDVSTKYGDIELRNGMAFYEDGAIRSIEPSKPIKINSPIGTLTAFDVETNGMNADINSLNFYEDGSIKSLLSSNDIVEVYLDGKLIKKIETEKKVSMCNDLVMTPIPIKIEFQEDLVIFNSSIKLDMNKYEFIVLDKKEQVKAIGTCSA